MQLELMQITTIKPRTAISCGFCSSNHTYVQNSLQQTQIHTTMIQQVLNFFYSTLIKFINHFIQNLLCQYSRSFAPLPT